MSLFEFIPDPKFPNHYEVCKHTGILKYKLAKERSYGDSYFLEEYQNQYKKTYYEDEPNLRMMARRRLGVIHDLFGSDLRGKFLLEIGSAAGFFLDEAKKLELSTKGYELSGREVDYSVSKLGLDVSASSILNVNENTYADSVDILCAFFVIEHILDIEALWQKMNAWIKPGGIVYLALPSFFGPTFQTNPEAWFATHPEDHFYDYDLTSLKKLLSILGYRFRYARPMSYHPKRDVSLRGRFPVWAYKLYSNFLCYGDTIEVAFQKK